MTKKPAVPIKLPPGTASTPGPSGAWVRETFESLVVALILAFLFRTFVAEAFVIPTGSMAPTLMGQHKDVPCSQCGFRFQAGASGEGEMVAQQGGLASRVDVVEVTCPMCRYMLNVDPRTRSGREYPTFGGDRILVSKSVYEFRQPQRWDVLVFKYPAEAETNYIKRLVGLPGETIKIRHGDIHIQADGDPDFTIERRPPDKLRAMAQMVYDNDYIVDAMTEKGWPLRWQPIELDKTVGEVPWTSSDGGRSYSIEDKQSSQWWLRYRHYVPTIDDWDAMEDGPLPSSRRPRAQLITDFTAYDTSILRGQSPRLSSQIGLHWVGDLQLECQLATTLPTGEVTLELVKGGKHFRCHFDIATGEARLEIEGLPDFQPRAQTAVKSLGSHQVIFSNVDQQLLLWVDGDVVTFDTPTEYPALDNERPQSAPSDPGDLSPAGIAARGAGARVSHIRLWRDIYYIAAVDGQMSDYRIPPIRVPAMSYDELVAFWSTPSLWSVAGVLNPFDGRREVTFPLSTDQFFVLGDNSQASADARLWRGERFVSRELLTGKALIIFWPHSFHTIPGTEIPFPFFPNFARMGFIR